MTKKLNTGVVITYDEKGNIKTLYSPFMEDERFDEPTTETVLSRQRRNQFKAMFQWS